MYVINITRIFRVIFYASTSTGIKPSQTHAFHFMCLPGKNAMCIKFINISPRSPHVFTRLSRLTNYLIKISRKYSYWTHLSWRHHYKLRSQREKTPSQSQHQIHTDRRGSGRPPMGEYSLTCPAHFSSLPCVGPRMFPLFPSSPPLSPSLPLLSSPLLSFPSPLPLLSLPPQFNSALYFARHKWT